MISRYAPPNEPSTAATPLPSWLHRYIPVTLAVCISLALTLGLFVFVHNWEGRESQTAFEYASKHLEEAMRRATERLQMTHEIMRQDFYGSGEVSREDFRLMCDPFLAHVPSLKVLQWAPRVAQSDRAEFEQIARREWLPTYEISKPGPHEELLPADSHAEYFPIWYAATVQGFEAKFGWDFGSIPVLQEAMHRARDTNSFTVSSPITLQMVGTKHMLVQTFLPVYWDFQNVKSVEDRRKNLRGFVVGLCQIDDLVENALKYYSDPNGIDLTVVDASVRTNRQVLYFHSSRLWEQRADQDAPKRESTDLADLNPVGIHYPGKLTFGGRQWSLICTPTPMFFTPYAMSWRSWTLLGVGLLLSYVVSRYTWASVTRTERIQRLVDQRTHELRQKDEQLRQSQKLEAVGSLAGGIAHEFNNLLQAIGGYTRYAMEGMKPEEQAYKDLESVLHASDRAASLTRQLLSFSRRQTVDRKHLDANEMVADLTKMLRPLLGEQINLKLSLGNNVGVIYADAGSFQQVLMNLCLNARDAMPSGGEIVVKTERLKINAAFASHYSDLRPGPYVELSVTDTGHGMAPDVREHIFEPFFTTKPVGQGTGLGLSTVYGIVQQHEGAIHVYSEPEHGTTFKIYLPAIASEADATSTTNPIVSLGGAETILVAEDDPLVQNISRRILEQAGYVVLTACDGEDTLKVLHERHNEISLVLLDVIMPKMSGRDVYRRIKEEFPDMRVVFCSGYDPESSQSNFILDERLKLVEKPYNPDMLLRTVREVLDAGEKCLV